MFVDETWIKTNMAPIRGWSEKGRRLKGFAPHGHWRTMTFLAGLRTACPNRAGFRRFSISALRSPCTGFRAGLKF